MNKRDLIHKISQKHKITKKETDLILNSILECIVDSVSNGEKVTLVGFGSFNVRVRNERSGKNPKTGEPLLIPSSRIPTFLAGKFFKKKVNQ